MSAKKKAQGAAAAAAAAAKVGEEDEESVYEEEEYDPKHHDFNYPFTLWGKRNLKGFDQRRVVRGVIMYHRKLDPFTIHLKTIELGGYEKVLKSSGDALVAKIVDWTRLSVGGSNDNRKTRIKSMKKFITLLGEYVKDLKKDTAQILIQDDIQASLAQRALNKLTSEAILLSSVISNDEKSLVLPEIRRYCSEIRNSIDEACSTLQAWLQSGADDGKRSVLWLGLNGIGKTFSLNLLLHLSERPHWLYPTSGDEPVCEALQIDSNFGTQDSMDDGEESDASDPVVDETDPVVDETTLIELSRDELRDEIYSSDEQKIKSQGKQKPREVLILVKPNKDDFKSSEDIIPGYENGRMSLPSPIELDMERSYLDTLTKRAFSYEDWSKLKKERGLVLPGYILTSAAEISARTTTAHATSIRLGTHWHFEVRYRSLEEIEKDLREYPFHANEHRRRILEEGQKDDQGEWNDGLETKHQYMLNLLRACVDPDPEDSNSQEDIEDADVEIGDNINFSDDPTVDLFPSDKKEIRFKSIISRVAGKRFVFVGKGKDALKDRVYLRRMLYGVIFQGLGSDFKAPKGTSHPSDCVQEVSVNLDDSILQSPELFIISEIIVYAPSILLEGNVEWQDAPGTNDNDPVKMQRLVDALEKCNGLMAFSERTEDKALIDYYRSKIVPRLWRRDSDLARLGLFLLPEKMFTYNADILEEIKRQNPRQVQNVRREMMKPFWKAAMDYRPPNDYPTLAKSDVEDRIMTNLNLGTWQVYPLMYTSLIMDSSSRVDVIRNVPTSGEISRRRIALDALSMTFGRNLIATLLHVSQGSTQLVLETLRGRIRRARDKMKGLFEAQGENGLTRPPSQVMDAALKLFPRNKKEKKILKEAADRTGKAMESIQQSVKESIKEKEFRRGNHVYLDGFKIGLRRGLDKIIQNKFRTLDNPLVVRDFYVWEGYFGVRQEFINACAGINVDEVIRLYRDDLRRFLMQYKDISSKWLIGVFGGGAGDSVADSWLRNTIAVFEDIINDMIRDMLCNEMLLCSDDEKARNAIDDLRSQLLLVSKNAVVNLYHEKMPILRHEAPLRNVNGDDKKKELVIRKFNENFDVFSAELNKIVQGEIDKKLDQMVGNVLAKLVQEQRSVSSVLLRQFSDVITKFNTTVQTNEAIANNVGHAFGFIKNRVDEILLSDKLAEVDGFWFEAWAKTKFILSDFLREASELLRSDATKITVLKTMVEGGISPGARTKADDIGAIDWVKRTKLGAKLDSLSLSSIKERGNAGSGAVVIEETTEKVIHVKLLNGKVEQYRRSEINFEGNWLTYEYDEAHSDDNRPILAKVLEDDPVRGICRCLFERHSHLEVRALHAFLSANWTASDANVVEAMVKCAGFPQELSKLLPSVWVKLVEAVFPEVEEAAFNTKVMVHSKERELHFILKGDKGEFSEATSKVFHYWFGYSLDEFLKGYNKPGNARFSAPLLLGASEMLQQPILVRVNEERVYQIRPVFRKQTVKRAYLLCWTPEKGFMPADAPIKTTSERPVKRSRVASVEF